jgi:hypothetical protein
MMIICRGAISREGLWAFLSVVIPDLAQFGVVIVVEGVPSELEPFDGLLQAVADQSQLLAFRRWSGVSACHTPHPGDRVLPRIEWLSSSGLWGMVWWVWRSRLMHGPS